MAKSKKGAVFRDGRWQYNKCYKVGKLRVCASAAEASGWRVFIAKANRVILDVGWHKTLDAADAKAKKLAKDMR